MLPNQLLTLSAMLFHLANHAKALPFSEPKTPTVGVPHITVPIHRRYADNATLHAQYHNQNAKHVARKYDILLENYERNTGQPFDGVPSTAQRRSLAKRSGRGSVTFLDPVSDNSGMPMLYYAEMQVGTPSVTFKVDLDTGSCDLWVKGSSCTGKCVGST